MSEIKRKKVNLEAFIRRVKRRWQQSGKLLQARKSNILNQVKVKICKQRVLLAVYKIFQIIIFAKSWTSSCRRRNQI